MKRLNMLNVNEAFIEHIYPKVTDPVIDKGIKLLMLDREITVRDIGIPILTKVGRWVRGQENTFT